MARPDQVALVLLKIVKGGCRQAGKGVKIIWAGHTTLTTTRGRPPGSDPTPITMNVSREAKWKQTCKWNDELTRTACSQKTGPAQALQAFRSSRIPAQQIQMPCQ